MVLFHSFVLVLFSTYSTINIVVIATVHEKKDRPKPKIIHDSTNEERYSNQLFFNFKLHL